MNTALTVIEDFLTYTKGDVITDPALVKQYSSSEYEGNVLKTAAPIAASNTTVTADAAAK